MKTKKKAIRRLTPAAFLESDEVCALDKGKQCSHVDLGTNSLQPNIDDLGVQLDSFSRGRSGLENATSDVCTGSSPTQYTASQKRKNCDALPVKYDHGRASGVLLHETLEAAATHTGIEHFTPIFDLGTDCFENPLDEKLGTSGDLSPIRKRNLFFSKLKIIDDSDDDTDNRENASFHFLGVARSASAKETTKFLRYNKGIPRPLGLLSHNMKTKKKAIRRLPPAAFLESDEVCALAKGKQCSHVDLGTKSLQPNIDDLGVQLDSFSRGLSGLENATSDVCTGSSPTQHRASQKWKNCDALPVKYDHGRASGVLLHETLEAAATHRGTEHFTPIFGTPANITDECSMQETQIRGTCNLDIHPSCNPTPTPWMDKGKRNVYETSNEDQPFTEAYAFQSFSQSATEHQFLCSEDLFTMDNNSETIIPEHLTDTTHCLPLSPCLHDNTSPSDASQHMRPILTPSSHVNMSTNTHLCHDQDRVGPSSRRTQRRPTQCLPEPYTFARATQRPPPANNVDPYRSNSHRQPEVRIHTSSDRSQRRGTLHSRGRPSRQGCSDNTFIDLCNIGVPDTYMYMGKCDRICHHCKARFWYAERVTSGSTRRPQYNKCCSGGKIKVESHDGFPDYIKELFTNRHFMENIRAYNQMFAMTSLGAEIDYSINMGRGPYVFKISGQLYHRIESLCPEQNARPQFLQLYIYDTENEVANRLESFQRSGHDFNEHNELVQLFRTARDKMEEANIPEFKVRLFGVVGLNQHELPTGDSIGAIVFEGGPDVETDFDVVIEQHNRELKSVNNQMEETSSIVPSSSSKGKEIVTSSEEVSLADLKESDIGKAIYSRVYRKWIPTNRQAKPILFCVMLIDKQASITISQANPARSLELQQYDMAPTTEEPKPTAIQTEADTSVALQLEEVDMATPVKETTEAPTPMDTPPRTVTEEASLSETSKVKKQAARKSARRPL
ncbi:hypothetical protein CTI12_AA271070 [Artemisia annua]|uniref:Helitron helicase-like domain-containing protein n=1 Tax=Artemisia annua TaxID=35608 RepID=A0A2U1NFT4_ARTAN|nr:hypothetical protein CTI12_AA271070 [Artemisia annua]